MDEEITVEELTNRLARFLLQSAYNTIEKDGTDTFSLGSAYLAAGAQLLRPIIPTDELQDMLRVMATIIGSDEIKPN